MAEISISKLQRMVRRIEIISSRLVTEQMAGEYHSSFKGQGMEFEEVRPYIPGDEIRSIDWNVTARYGEPHVKRYREERERTVFIVADASASCRFGTRGEFKSELMAEIAAVLAFTALANNDRVGLLLCSDQIELFVPPKKGRRHCLRIVREVLGFRPKSAGTNLGLGLDHLRRVLNRRAVVFLLSDFMDLDFDRSMAAVARRHDLVAIAVDDDLEAELPALGLIDVFDPETGGSAVVDSGSRKFREAYARRQEERKDARKQTMIRNKTGLIEIRTGQPYAAEIARFFRRRAHSRF